jgi:uridylate kinase
MLYILSVGGSLIYPPDGIDTKFINSFGAFINQEINKDKRFILVSGGGQSARDYIKAAKKLKIDRDDQDNLGISATRQNALLLQAFFKKRAYSQIITKPNIKALFSQKIAIAGGWRPGRSTDYVAVTLAKTYGANAVINLSNIDYVYNKDPKIKGAKKIKKMTWPEFRKIVGNKWSPGINAPFDPVASRLAQNYGLTVIVLNGKKINNLRKCLNNQEFIGTTIKD